MEDEYKEAGIFIHEISLQKFLTSVGIQMAAIAMDIIDTDKMYASEWQLETAALLGGISAMCHHITESYATVSREMIIRLPHDVVAVTVANPLRDDSMTSPESDDAGDGMDGGDFIPF